LQFYDGRNLASFRPDGAADNREYSALALEFPNPTGANDRRFMSEVAVIHENAGEESIYAEGRLAGPELN
jgi:hypothetical protein